MQSGYFYFLTNQYGITFHDYGVIPNKDPDETSSHGRPYFYAVKDAANPNIMWMIPVSSKIEKYKKIYEEKKKKYKIKEYDGIVFGELQGHQRAFLIQNICPVIIKYIDSQYIDTKTQKPIVISDNTSKKIVARSQKLIELSKKGIRCTMTDVPHILECLYEELKE